MARERVPKPDRVTRGSPPGEKARRLFHLDVLIDEDWISIRVHSDEARWPCRPLVGFSHQRHAFLLQLALPHPNVGERLKIAGVLVPPGIEGQGVPLEHALKEAHHSVTVLQDEPVL